MIRLAERKRAWEARTVAKTLAQAPERQADFATSSGIPVDRLYTPAEDVAGDCPALSEDYLARLGFSRRVPVHPRRAADHVPRALLDDAPVRRIWHGR